MSLTSLLPGILINTLSIVNFVLIMQLLFGLDLYKKWQYYLVMAAAYMAVNIGIEFAFQGKPLLQTGLIYICFLVIVGFLAKKHFFKKVLYTIPTILLYVQWSNVMDMLDELFGLDFYPLSVEEELYGPFYILSDMFLLMMLSIWLYHACRTGRRLMLNVWETMALSLFCFFSPYMVLYLEKLTTVFDDFWYSYIWISFMLILNAAIFYAILHRSAAHYYRGTAENYREQFRSEYDYFRAYKEKQSETAAFRHDWKNHMLLLQGMLDDGNYEKAAEYFRTLTAERISSGKQLLTGNEIVDIILNAKMQKMSERRIKVNCNGGLEMLSFMEDVDICILFSNLIDNAIEANEKCDGEGFLTIRASHNPSMLMVAVSNRMSGEVQEKDGRLLSSKNDEGSHGIGTQNIFSVVHKYQGEYSLKAENETFTITMTFPIDHSS